MGKKEKLVDDYIARSADFAKPILHHLRQLIHTACPHVKEVIKWRFPNFEYQGLFCNVAAFKEHCSFGFWKAALLKDTESLKASPQAVMSQLDKIKTLADLPPDKILIAYIKEAVRLNEEGIKPPPRSKITGPKELKIPSYFAAALHKNKTAQTLFEGFSHSHKKDYIEWITEAKTEETRHKRLAKALEQIAEGKSRNWKYERPKESAGKSKL